MEQRVEGETQSSASKEIPLWSESMLSMPEITGLADSLEFPQSPIEAGTPAVDQQKINDYRNRELELKVANQMDQTTTLFQHLYNKFYYCNFTYYLTPQGFQKYWVEQWGVVLYLWLVPSELGSLSYTAQLDMGQFVRNEIDPPTEFLQAIKQNDPEFINILDGVVELSTNYAFDGVQPPYPYTNYFAVGKISTCPLFAVGSTIQMNNWVASIRLAKFEVQRLNSLFTVRWLESPLRSHAWSDLKIEPFKSGLFRGDIKYEGPLQIRIPYSNVWRQYHVIVTNKTGQAAFSQNLQSKIFNRGKVLSTDYSRRGTMLVYNNSSSAQKGKSPLLVITNCMWVNAIFPMDEVTPEKIKNVTLAKIYGEMQLSSSIISKDLKGSSTERSLFPFIQDWREVNNLEDLGQIFQGLERRPLPKELLIMAPNHFELAKWIVSISASFGLDCDSEVADKELNEMTKIKEQEIITDYVPVIWPTALYLSVEEIGGISMESTDLAETFNRFSHYLNQKVVFSTQDKMQSWCEATAKGDWERNICDRKEIEFKYTKLMEWKEYCNQKLLENGITVTKPDVNLLVTAMSSLIPWLSEVFQKLVADGPHLPDSPKIVVQPQKELPKQEPIESNSDGSISEEERSSEGSVSEDENSERSPVKVEPLPLQDTAKLEDVEDDDSSEEELEDVYAPNSLLAQVAENQKVSKAPKNMIGPFITTVEGPNRNSGFQPLFAQGVARPMNYAPSISSQSEPRGGLVDLIGLASNKKPKSGPLVGDVSQLNKKQSFNAGLVGQLQKRENERLWNRNSMNNTPYDTLMRRNDHTARCYKFNKIPTNPRSCTNHAQSSAIPNVTNVQFNFITSTNFIFAPAIATAIICNARYTSKYYCEIT